MGFRTPAPDGRREKDGSPLLVLQENAILKGIYHTRYLTWGGMSIIYLASKEAENLILKEVDSKDVRKVVALTQEKGYLERLDHPGIVKVHDFFEENGYCYLVMDYVEGMTLDKKIPIGSEIFLSESQVRDWAFQLLDIFEFLHEQRPPIIYRDLKPKNIMIDKNGRIRLIDFGIARTYKEGRTFDTDHMGSMITASPEHYGGAQTDKRSDIYTLGATLHFIVTNGRCTDREPFDFPLARTVNRGISDVMEEVIDRALQLEPEDRFQTIAQMRNALRGGDPEEAEKQDEKTGTGQSVVQESPEARDRSQDGSEEQGKPEFQVKIIDDTREFEKKDAIKKFVITAFGVLIGIALALGLLSVIATFGPSHVIQWTDAGKYMGKEKVVEGKIVAVYMTSDGNIYLHCNPYLSDENFSVLIPHEAFGELGGETQPFYEDRYLNKTIRVSGTIEMSSINRPGIKVRKASQLTIMERSAR